MITNPLVLRKSSGKKRRNELLEKLLRAEIAIGGKFHLPVVPEQDRKVKPKATNNFICPNILFCSHAKSCPHSKIHNRSEECKDYIFKKNIKDFVCNGCHIYKVCLRKRGCMCLR